MAIQGIITHKGITTNAYVKVSIIGISENVSNTDTEQKPVMTKKFMLQYGYALKAVKGVEQFGSGQESIECDPDENLYSQAYADFALKNNISSEKV